MNLCLLKIVTSTNLVVTTVDHQLFATLYYLAVIVTSAENIILNLCITVQYMNTVQGSRGKQISKLVIQYYEKPELYNTILNKMNLYKQ